MSLWRSPVSALDSMQVTTFVKSGDIKAAIDCCMELNNWNLAIDLAKKHDFLKYVQNNIAKCTKYLVQTGNPLHAALIHCEANQQLDAAKIFLQLAKQMAQIKVIGFGVQYVCTIVMGGNDIAQVSNQQLCIIIAVSHLHYMSPIICQNKNCYLKLCNVLLQHINIWYLIVADGAHHGEKTVCAICNSSRCIPSFFWHQAGNIFTTWPWLKTRILPWFASIQPHIFLSFLFNSYEQSFHKVVGNMQHDATTCLDRLFKNAWHGAEAYHFWLLSHRHLYAGRYEQSMQVDNLWSLLTWLFTQI